MSEYLKKFEKKIEELKKLEYCDLYSVTEENLEEVSNEIARRLVNTFGVPDVYEVGEIPCKSVAFGIACTLRTMLYEEPSIGNEARVLVHVYSPRIFVDHKRNECIMAPFTLRCNAGNFHTEGTAYIAELYAGFDFPKLRFWDLPHCYIVKGDEGSRYVELDWRVHDEPGYPEFKAAKSTDAIGVGYRYIDGLWATVLTKGDLDYVREFVGNDYDEVDICKMYE